LPIWAGVIPIKTTFESPISDPKLNAGIPISESVKKLMNKDQSK